MNTRLTGILTDGDTQAVKEWIDKKLKSESENKTEISDLKTEIALLRQIIDKMDKKIDNIEQILEKVSE